MLQVATNQYGVAISSSETIISNSSTPQADPYIEFGISEVNMTKTIMEQAKNSYEGLLLLASMIEKMV